MCCPTVVICAILSTVLAQLVVSRRGGCCFSSFYDYSLFFIVLFAVCVGVLSSYLASWSSVVLLILPNRVKIIHIEFVQ
jgi:hypothetical protein